ncbi:MutS-like protein [Gelidibacter algens]|uniref:MutS-like protein n=1 Tax=Gelidibacter algens TaxID=49280 RepID=A0A1A7R1A9_9FLAO|nr:DNA mismatch repair protein MutS [Gelidibacter algens]OBX25308.1 DNA mismatch repair protein MutS [Gelidibacter algens]RAJ25792.1 MutS-like protein [Gelidibacter algens]
MDNPNTYYQQQSERYQTEASALYKQMTLFSTLRILVFLLTAFGVYMTYSNWQLAAGIAIAGLLIFIVLLSKHTDIKAQRQLKIALTDINKTELEISKGNFHDRDQGLSFQDPLHFYSLDIDLFGRGSFFQFINRTVIKEGTQQLAAELKANNVNDIEQRQEAIKELASKPEWRQLYSATASLITVETSAHAIISWLKDHKSFLPKTMQWIPTIYVVGSVILLSMFFLKVLSVDFLGYWLFVGLAITAIYLKKINVLAYHTEKIKDTFKQYALLLDQIENENFTSDVLVDKQKQIKSESEAASIIFNKLSKVMDALDNRNNFISAIFGNGYFLTDLKNSYKVEQWLADYKNKVEDWFEVVSFFDAYNSLGNYAFNHPQYVFPQVTNDKEVIKAKDLGHPLLKVAKRVDNDLTIQNEQFFIVTGANMAGKSTFLRTVSLHIVMANVGLPVCASSSTYNPVKLITSMRTSDSLTDDSSYFFSELTRLKFIVDAIQQEPYFIILDEILKGTNSTDKAIGSRKFVEKLVASDATGIIATHDLSLCDIEKELAEVKNYYFDAEIIDDELHFDYTFKTGVCKNMNASFLLKKMEII